jgi:hypothetical protein
MSATKWKRPNAQKHGVFSATAILPGEDAREFDELHSALIEEWKPVGATEEDAVLTIAKAVWRKRRLQRFIEVQLWTKAVDPNHPSSLETLGLAGLAMLLAAEPETGFKEYASRYLRKDRINYLEQKVPRSNYKSESEWANAMIGEIKSLIALPPLLGPEHDRVVKLQYSSENLFGDLFKQELALDERLDTMIDRAVKRLIQTKPMKQMLGQTAVDRSTDQQKESRQKLRGKTLGVSD